MPPEQTDTEVVRDGQITGSVIKITMWNRKRSDPGRDIEMNALRGEGIRALAKMRISADKLFPDHLDGLAQHVDLRLRVGDALDD